MWQQHKKLTAYLKRIERTVNNLGDVHIELYREDRASFSDAVLRIRLRFQNQYLLEISEAVYIEDEKIAHRRYRYHFQDARNRLLFRYDNAPHFPDLDTFPHHKHLPDAVIASKKPVVAEVIREARGFMG